MFHFQLGCQFKNQTLPIFIPVFPADVRLILMSVLMRWPWDNKQKNNQPTNQIKKQARTPSTELKHWEHSK